MCSIQQPIPGDSHPHTSTLQPTIPGMLIKFPSPPCTQCTTQGMVASIVLSIPEIHCRQGDLWGDCPFISSSGAGWQSTDHRPRFFSLSSASLHPTPGLVDAHHKNHRHTASYLGVGRETLTVREKEKAYILLPLSLLYTLPIHLNPQAPCHLIFRWHLRHPFASQ